MEHDPLFRGLLEALDTYVDARSALRQASEGVEHTDDAPYLQRDYDALAAAQRDFRDKLDAYIDARIRRAID